jgi:PAS domain S-box-containing protein
MMRLQVRESGFGRRLHQQGEWYALHTPGMTQKFPPQHAVGGLSLAQFAAVLPIAMYITDTEGFITYYNEAAAALWGRRPILGEERFSGALRLWCVDGEPLPHDQTPTAVLLRAETAIEPAKLVVERPDGSRRTFVSHPTPLYDVRGQFMGAANVLLDVTGQEKSETDTSRLAAIVTSSHDAIIAKDLDGYILSWNQGAQRLFGYAPEEIIGKPVLTLIPVDRHHEETEILSRLRRGERVEHYETVRQRKDGSLVDISLTVSPIKNAAGRIVGASKIARDISERKRTETLLRRQKFHLETLNRVSRAISQDLDMDRIVQTVTDLATELSGAKFGAFFYNVHNEKGESYQLYALSGASREAFDKLGMPRNTAVFAPTFHGFGIVRSGDIRKDPRYGKNAPHAGMPAGHLPVVSYLAVPVISAAGEVLGGLFFGHDQPDVFRPETETLIVAIAAQAAVAIDNARLHRAAQTEIEQRKKAESGQRLLLNEIKHRVKNTISMVQAMANQTFQHASKVEKETFIARLHAMAGAHDLLTQQNWEAVQFLDIVKRAMSPFGGIGERIAIEGPELSVDSNKALLAAMVLHELGTNAVKYGALSCPGGRVDIQWELLDQSTRQKLSLTWRERNGPPVKAPTRKGFGTRMIERALSGEEGKAVFDYQASGLVCALKMTVAGSSADS